jgi:hypothetical protein
MAGNWQSLDRALALPHPLKVFYVYISFLPLEKKVTSNFPQYSTENLHLIGPQATYPQSQHPALINS